MATELARYVSSTNELGIDDGDIIKNKEMSITAFYGRSKKDVQFTIGFNYCTLTKKQVKHLIKTLQSRLDGTYTDFRGPNVKP